MKKVLITGLTGFAGSHLAEYLLTKNDYEIHGTYLTDSSLENVSGKKEELRLIQIDLTDKAAVTEMVSSVKPDFIYHLAALPFPRDSFNDPTGYIHNNIDAELHLLEAARKENLTDTRILIVSSADVYGLVHPSDLPIDEETPLRPTSPYSISKIAQDYLGLQYSLAYGLDVVRVRPFNHLGPRLPDALAPSAFAKKIAEIEKGTCASVLEAGDCSAKRDYTDVRDMVEAYVLAIENGEKGDVYNIGTGKSIQIQDILDTLLSLSTVKDIEVKTNDNLNRPIDIPELVCDNSKFVNLTSWSPKIPIQKTLEDLLNYWRNL